MEPSGRGRVPLAVAAQEHILHFQPRTPSTKPPTAQKAQPYRVGLDYPAPKFVFQV